MAGGMADHQKHRQRPEAGQPGRPTSANLEPGHLTDLFDASRVRPFLFDRQRSCPKHFLSQTFESFHRRWSHFFCSEFFFLQGLYLQCFFLSHDQIKTLLKSLKLFCFNLFSSSFSMEASIKQLRHNVLFSFASAVAPVRQE